jgi:hypothetical protein
MAQGKNEKITFPRMYLEWDVTDKDGKLIDKGRKESQTWVGNIVRFLWMLFQGANVTSVASRYQADTPAAIRNTANTSKAMGLVSSNSTYLGVGVGAGELVGIVVGASDAAVNINQYDLVSKILHGAGAGQLFYGANTVDSLSETSSTFTFRVVRSMTNQSGGSVTVREIGLFIKLSTSPGDIYVSMLARDVLSSPITVPAGSTLTVRYIVSHAV